MLPDNGEIFIKAFNKVVEEKFTLTTQDTVLLVSLLVVSLVLAYILCKKCGGL